MRTEPLSLSALLLLLAATTGVADEPDARGRAPLQYQVTEILPPDDPSCETGFYRQTYARRFNEAALAVGYDLCYVATDDPMAPHLSRGNRAFRWTRRSGSERLAAVNAAAVETLARDVNAAGTAVGWEINETGLLAPLWPRSGGAAYVFEPTACEAGGGIIARSDGINDRGSIAGSDSRRDDTGQCRSRWILKLPSGVELLGPSGGTPNHINNHNVLVGFSGNNAVRWSPAGDAQILTAGVARLSRALAWSVNDHDQAVGQLERMAEDTGCLTSTDAKLWRADGTEQTLPALRGMSHNAAFAINDRVEIVGNSHSQEPCEDYQPFKWRAVIWYDGKVRDLNTLIPRAVARRVQLVHASAVNKRGQILARGIRRHEARMPCPEINFDPVTGEPFYDATRRCQSEYAFLLTPLER